MLNTDAAWSVIGQICIRGPFDTNTRFAAEALVEKAEPVTATLLNSAMARRSWRTRRAAIRSLKAIDTDEARILEATGLMDLDPCVRLAIVNRVLTMKLPLVLNPQLSDLFPFSSYFVVRSIQCQQCVNAS